MKKIKGVATGLVTDLNDPASEGRIQLEFPWLDGSYRSGWAPIAVPMAGGRRGMYFMPEVGDEVLVAFEHGDADHPYVVGFLWNGQDLPPDDGINFSVRRLRTVSGHVIEFDDNPGQEKINIKTQGEHTILLDDPAGTITIQTKGAQKILMEDSPARITINTTSGTSAVLSDTPSSVKLSTVAGNTLEVSDVPGIVKLTTNLGVSLELGPAGITVSAATGVLNITCLQANLSAASVSINAPIATFSGVVVASTVITNAVVSSSYTPGAGNIW